MPSGIGVGLAGAAIGGIAGGSDDEQNTTKNIAAATGRELDLQNQSFSNYMQQLALQNQQENSISGGANIQGSSRNVLDSILGGGSFNLSPEEQQRIENVRSATIAAGQGDIQNFVNDNLSGVSNAAGARGVRGQALSELQGRAINEGTKQYGNLVGQANLTAAQQSQQAPLQRIALQGGFAQNNANFQDQLRQQAIQNRGQLQNPALLNMLQNERLAAAGTTVSTPSNLGTVLGGALGGAGSLMGAYGSLNGGGGKKMAGGGVVGSSQNAERKFVNNAKQFEKGFNGGEDISDSIRNIREALGLEPKKMAEGGVAGYHLGSTPANSTARDKIHVMLSPNEIVIPESHSHDKGLARAYVDYVHRKKEEQEAGGM